jgi:regulation of enolase protein 1 (concanavalin A-like superfamily)
MMNRLEQTLVILLVMTCRNVVAQEARPSGAASDGLRLGAVPFSMSLHNATEGVRVVDGRVLHLAARGGTNLFNSPSGGYYRQDAPMVLFQPDDDFVLTARVAGELKNVYDVAALVIYQDDDWWAKLCFENSVRKEATIVSVVTRQFSDDANSLKPGDAFAYLAMAKKGAELAFHYSPDGKQWELIRHFRLELKPGFRIGFAAHGSTGDGFAATFSDVTYSTPPPSSIRQLEAPRQP